MPVDILRLRKPSDRIDYREILERAEQLGSKIAEGTDGKPVTVIAAADGGLTFANDLSTAMIAAGKPADHVIQDSFSVHRTVSRGPSPHLTWDRPPEVPLAGAHLVLVMGIIGARRRLATLATELHDLAYEATSAIQGCEPGSLTVVSMLDRPLDRKIPNGDIPADRIISGFRVASGFVVGHGLGLADGRYIGLPDIASLEAVQAAEAAAEAQQAVAVY